MWFKSDAKTGYQNIVDTQYYAIIWNCYTDDSSLAQIISVQKVLAKTNSVHKCKNVETWKYSRINLKRKQEEEWA